MSGQVVYLVLRKDTLDRTMFLQGFVSERDADSYIEGCKKNDDRYGLASMKYAYNVQQVLIQHSSVNA